MADLVPVKTPLLCFWGAARQQKAQNDVRAFAVLERGMSALQEREFVK